MKAVTVTLTWGDGQYPFALRIGEVRELEALRNIGIGALYARMLGGDWWGEDAYHVIRLGLIGGGMTPVEALRKCQTYVLERPLAENVPFARVVLLAAFHGAEDSGGKAEVAADGPAAPATASTSPPSTAAGPRSASRRARSTK
jgi:hypothetical protein